jgi:peroxiredoxin
MTRFLRPPRRVLLLLCALAAPLVVVAFPLLRDALDDRPNLPAAALPAPGARLPDFRLPMLGGDTLTTGRLRGRPVVLALWSRDCGVSRGALAGIDQLRRDYERQGVAVVVLADDGDTTALRQVMLGAGVRTPVAYADGALERLFDQSRRAPERERYRVAFGLPSFLLIGADGRVVHRDAGVSLPEYRARSARLQRMRDKLDSLLAAGTGTRNDPAGAVHPRT